MLMMLCYFNSVVNSSVYINERLDQNILHHMKYNEKLKISDFLKEVSRFFTKSMGVLILEVQFRVQNT